MDEVERRLMVFAVDEYPGLCEEGFAYYNVQVEAYRALDIPLATLRNIKRRAAARDGDDFVGRRQTVEQEVRAYRRLQGAEEADIPPKTLDYLRKLARIESGQGADYRSQCAAYAKKVVAYRGLERLRALGISEEQFNVLMQLARHNHPGNLAGQLEEVTRNLEAFGNFR